jgi:hypothetical protein
MTASKRIVITRDSAIRKCAAKSADVKFGNYMSGNNFPRGLDLHSMVVPLNILYPKSIKTNLQLLVSLEQEYFDAKRANRG